MGRSAHGCLVLEEEGKILVAGGRSINWVYTKSVELYDINGETWSQLGNMPVTSKYFFTLGSGLGARDFDSPAAYAYDLAKDNWSRLAKDLEFKSEYYLSFDVEDIPMICSLEE